MIRGSGNSDMINGENKIQRWERNRKDNGIVIGDTAGVEERGGVKGSRVIVHDRGPLGGAAGPGMAVETGVAAVSTPAFLKPVPESAHVRCAGETRAREARAGGVRGLH